MISSVIIMSFYSRLNLWETVDVKWLLTFSNEYEHFKCRVRTWNWNRKGNFYFDDSKKCWLNSPSSLSILRTMYSSYGKFTQLENKLIRHFLSFFLSFFPSLLKLLGHNYCLFRFQRKQIVLPLNFSIYFFVFICCLYFHNWRRIFKSEETLCWPLAIFAV